MVFDRSARMVSVAQKEHEQIFPKPGWVEHDALEILRRTHEVIREGLEKRGLQGSDVAASARRGSLWLTLWSGRTRGWRRRWRTSRATEDRTGSGRRPVCR